ncbi:MAG: GNAT family N-acetyltransferase [Weeksellaceae bacterium]|nr:GNAT family N-acetyltransferase [Weeksellaceae bacterium]
MIHIEHENNEKNGRFIIFYENKEAGEMTYTWAGNDKFIIDHTLVSPEFGGKGLAKKLILESIDYARANSLKIIPLCPYAKSVFEKNKEFSDVFYS